MKKTAWLAVAFAVVVVAFVVLSTFRQERVRCEVCISYQGRRDCRTASSTTREGALRAATDNVCGQLASGVTENSQCLNTPPDSVNWLR